MAGYTDSAMRALCHRMGAEGTVTEMVSAKAVVYRDKKTIQLGKIAPEEGAVLLQIFGKEPSVMAEAAAMLAEGYCGTPPFGIDINMGCPVPKIVGNGEGSALMREPALAEKIVCAVRRALPPDMPLTVKLRLGWDSEHRNAREVAEAVTRAGAEAVFLHGRTRAAMYGGRADWEAIARLAEGLSVPVIGNGDITTAEEAALRLRESACYGLMIGRGAVGNPFLFREVAALLAGEPLPPPPSDRDKVSTALCQLRAAIAEKGETVAVREARKHMAAYVHGLRGAPRLRAALHLAESYREVEELFLSVLSL